MNIKNGNGKNSEIMCCHGHFKKVLFAVFISILTVFFVVLTISTFIGVLNKIKEGRNIGKSDMKNTISVSGTGEVYAQPDLGVIDISVVTEKKTVAEAVSENANKMNAVISSVKSNGVSEKDLKTMNFSITPQYEYPKGTEVYGGGRTLSGYEVSQRLEVKVRNLEKVGDIINGATSAGANEVGNLYFTIDEKDQFENAAKEEAIKKAKEMADIIAKQLGVKLVKISGFYENSYAPYSSMKEDSVLGMGGGVSSIAPTPTIQTGENKITSNVTITYEIE